MLLQLPPPEARQGNFQIVERREFDDVVFAAAAG